MLNISVLKYQHTYFKTRIQLQNISPTRFLLGRKNNIKIIIRIISGKISRRALSFKRADNDSVMLKPDQITLGNRMKVPMKFK
jgi:hypothetical protein